MWKKRKYESKYKSEWASEFTGLAKGSDETKARCTFCVSEFSIAHGGKNEADMDVDSTFANGLWIDVVLAFCNAFLLEIFICNSTTMCIMEYMKYVMLNTQLLGKFVLAFTKKCIFT